MAAYAYTDFTSVMAHELSPEVVIAFAKKKNTFVEFVKPGKVPWENEQIRIPIRAIQAMAGRPRALGSGLGVGATAAPVNWLVQKSDTKSITVPVVINTETTLLTPGALISQMDMTMQDARDDMIFLMGQSWIGDGNGTRAVVSGIYDSDGTTWSGTNATTEALLTVRRGTTGAGSLHRIRKNEVLAFHSAATSTIRVYGKVLEVKPAFVISDVKYDAIIVTTTGVEQNPATAGLLGVDASDEANKWVNVADGDYIRTVGGYGACPQGVDAWAATTGTFLGINKATLGNDFANFTAYPVGGELTPDVLESVLEQASHFIDDDELAGYIRLHPCQWRALAEREEIKVQVQRPYESKAKGIINLGWGGFTFTARNGKAFALWQDFNQQYCTADIIPPGAFQSYAPPDAEDKAWRRDPQGQIKWTELVATPSGAGVVTPGFNYQADRLAYSAIVCPAPQKVIRLTTLTERPYG